MTNKWDDKLRDQYEEAFFQELMAGYAEHEGEALRQQAAQDEAPDPERLAQMNRRLAREMRRRKRKRGIAVLRHAKKVAAVFFAAVVVYFSLNPASADAIRVRVLNFFLERRGDATVYGFRAEQDGLFVPSYIPSDLNVELYDERLPARIVLQSSDASRYVSITIGDKNTRLSVDSENLDVCKQVSINGTDADYTEKEGLATLVWRNPEETYIAIMVSNLPEEEMIEIAESIAF